MRNTFGYMLAAALLLDAASAQTWSQCNPLKARCPADTALNRTINVDFGKGPVDSFLASGSPAYSSDGASFTVKNRGDAPQLASVFYIMFGRVEITMKAAPGKGMVSALVLESDDLDEIDMEWLGARPDEMQSNYFGKGKTSTYDRGQLHSISGTQTKWAKYTVDWTQDRIMWVAGTTILRTLRSADAEADQYPQTPMRIKLGTWAGGDPSNAPGTVSWAGGEIDYAKGPFSMHVQSIVITDYSTGREYRYKDQSGTWQSIEAVGGSVNGNYDSRRNGLTATVGATPPGTNLVSVPVGGIGRDGSSATRTQTGWPWVAGASPTGGSIPSGWYITSEGKIMRSATAAAPPSVHCGAALLPLLALSIYYLW